ncbi:MAG: type IVB secretion system protein IcmH/DotU [Coxiellaceae bacterium]|jgi:type IV/VI secretion system ImpK/VasF family protein|nr:type IVB secretion system protein IcmH/DotU [Coxiellaceae bacterium]
MNEDCSLLAESPDTIRAFDKTTTLPAFRGYYRSRIYISNININPMIGACDQLLNLVIILKTAEFPEDSDKFLHDLAHEIRSFEHQAQIANYPSNIIIAARYALCSLLDEVITLTPWGQKNHWSEKDLLSLFHNEKYGGSRFFSIIDRALEDITNNLHLIELLYLCLNLGFTGKYQEVKSGKSELLAITNKLYQIISQHNNRNAKNLLIHETNSQIQHKHMATTNFILATINTPKKLFSIALASAIIISGLIYLGISLKLNQASSSVYTTIKQIPKR